MSITASLSHRSLTPPWPAPAGELHSRLSRRRSVAGHDDVPLLSEPCAVGARMATFLVTVLTHLG